MKLLPRRVPGGPRAAAFLVLTLSGWLATAALAGCAVGAAGENLLDEVDHVTGLHWKVPRSSAP